MSTLGGETLTMKMRRVKFAIKGNKDCELNTAVEIEALAIDKICEPLQPVKVDLSRYGLLTDSEFADSYEGDSEEISLLIGADYYYSIVENDIRKGNSNDPTAVSTKLGWILCG